MSAMIAWRWMSTVDEMMSRSIERLSSGFRINHAADDPAGLAIADRLQTQVRGLRQSMRNIEDGISVVQTAESALNEVSALLQRGRELAIQAANGVYGPDQKAAIKSEMDSLLEEVDRVAEATEFNGRKLLGGSEPIILQVGPNYGPGNTIDLPVLKTDRTALGITVIDPINSPGDAMSQFSSAIQAIIGMRSRLGATQNRLEHTYNSTAATMENLTAAESRIRDADMAEEMLQFAKAQILMQTSTAMLVQAHKLQRDSVLSLLRAL